MFVRFNELSTSNLTFHVFIHTNGLIPICWVVCDVLRMKSVEVIDFVFVACGTMDDFEWKMNLWIN